MKLSESKIKALDYFTDIENEIDALIESGHDFSAFILLSLGIEFIGAFFDGLDFEALGQSENRFIQGIKLFKNPVYTKKGNKWCYEKFRGPLVHQFRPGVEIVLTSLKKNGTALEKHFTQNEDGKFIFVAEQLLEDFKKAVVALKKKFEKPNSLNKEKPEQEYIHIVNQMTGGTLSISAKSVGK